MPAFLSPAERRAGLALALIFFLRMLGLFLILPVLALGVQQFPINLPLATGLALGIYALTQACFQIPFGKLSDRLGRKPVIAMGLGIFILGSLLAAHASATQSMSLLILGRALQGAGAIAPAIMALAADLSAPERRSRMMALIGAGVGLAFGLAFAISPTLYALLGLGKLFWLCAGLGSLAILALLLLAPEEPCSDARGKPDSNSLELEILRGNPGLLACCLGAFVSHLILMSNFTILPILLRDRLDMPVALHWRFYIPVLLTSLAFSVAMIFYGRHREIRNLHLCMSLFAIAQFFLLLSNAHANALYAGMLIFFIGFNYLEAALPSAVSRSIDAGRRGAALGLYNTIQFLGIFCGGLIGGAMQEWAGTHGIFLFCAALPLACIPWLRRDR